MWWGGPLGGCGDATGPGEKGPQELSGGDDRVRDHRQSLVALSHSCAARMETSKLLFFISLVAGRWKLRVVIVDSQKMYFLYNF